MNDTQEKNHTPWVTVENGIRKYEHLKRKYRMRPDVYYALRYMLNGKRYEEGLGWASQGWTLERARQTLAELRIAKKTGEGEVTLQDKRARANAEREAEKAKPTIARLWEIYQSTKGNYASFITDRANFQHFAALHDRLPESLKTHEVSAIAKELQEQGKSPQTVKNVLELLRRLVNFGAKQELCPRPEALRFNMPKIDNHKTECLTPDQAKALLEALDAEQDQNLAALVRLALTTGMRRGALLGLQWEDLDFEKGLITLRGETAKSGKTSQLPMTVAARTVLEGVKHTGSPYVFPGKNGGKRIEIRRFLERVRKAAKLPDDFRPLHGLRHTYASWLASSGKVDLFTLQKLMTHGSPQMTQRYAHLADEAVRRAASVIDECLDVAVNAAATKPVVPPQAKVVKFPPKKRK